MQSSTDSEPECDGLLLSGGRGTRVGGHDKGLLPVAGQRAVDRAFALLRPLCRSIYLSANRNLDAYRELGATLLPDLRPDFPGPLGALEAAAAQPLAPLLLLLPVDLPLLEPAVPARLLERLRGDDDLDLVYASDGERAQYLCACVRSGCLAAAGELLDGGEHRVRAWVERLRSLPLELRGAEAAGLRNFNAPGDWETLRRSVP